MKFSVLGLLLCLVSVSAEARDWWNRGDRDWRGGRDGRGGHHERADFCTYQDKGWEEHWSGHDSCQECTRKHGKCVETCYTKEYKVVVTGLVRDRWSNSEREEEFVGYGQSEWRAESDAYQACQYRNAYNCQVKRRDTDNREISRSMCAR